MTPDQLRTFAVVAAHKNISSAALELHLSQPAVSGQLRLLAESFGEALYHRSGRGITLTPAGEQLAVQAERIRRAHDEAVALSDSWARGGGVVRIGASTTPASYLLPHLVARFQAAHPNIRVAMIRSGNTVTIAGRLHELDIGFIEGPVPRDIPVDTAVAPWYMDQVVAIAPPGHPLAKRRKPVSLEALAAHPMVWREAGSGLRRMVETIFAERGIVPAAVLDVTSVEGIKEAVRAGMGIGFVSSLAMSEGDSTLAVLPLVDHAVFRRQFSILVTHHEAASRACRAFLALAIA